MFNKNISYLFLRFMIIDQQRQKVVFKFSFVENKKIDKHCIKI